MILLTELQYKKYCRTISAINFIAIVHCYLLQFHYSSFIINVVRYLLK